MPRLKQVEFVSSGVFLPGNPVPYDRIEDFIGSLDDAPPLIKDVARKWRPLVKKIIGIKQCYFAIDPSTKEITESNTSMSTKAVKAALKKANMAAEELDLLVLATPFADHQTPPTSTLVQAELGIEKIAEIEIHSNCTGISKAFQVAFDALRLGRYKNAAVVYSQLSSAYLHASHYNQEKVKNENLLLRWFLSDSASAGILKGRDTLKKGIRVAAVHNDSVGGKLPPAMWYHHGAKHLNLKKSYELGHHHLGQDYDTVSKLAPDMLSFIFSKILSEAGLEAKDIDHVLVTSPSIALMEKGKQRLLKDLDLAPEKWFENVSRCGYSGGSSIIIGLDEMIGKGLFKAGQNLICTTIESSKWMVGGFLLEHLK